MPPKETPLTPSELARDFATKASVPTHAGITSMALPLFESLAAKAEEVKENARTIAMLNEMAQDHATKEPKIAKAVMRFLGLDSWGDFTGSLPDHVANLLSKHAAESAALRRLAESNGIHAHNSAIEAIRLRDGIREALKCSDIQGARSFLKEALAGSVAGGWRYFTLTKGDDEFYYRFDSAGKGEYRDEPGEEWQESVSTFEELLVCTSAVETDKFGNALPAPPEAK